MRLLLVIALVHGLAPGLAEVGEAVVHWARTGHAAHSAADRGDLGDQGPEHGCGTTQHVCSCCTAQPVVPAPETAVGTLDRSVPAPVLERRAALATRAPARPFRPPIA